MHATMVTSWVRIIDIFSEKKKIKGKKINDINVFKLQNKTKQNKKKTVEATTKLSSI